MRLRATLVASALALLAAVVPASASASWKGATSGSASAKARTLGSVAQPTTSIVNRNVTVRWTAPASGAPVTGYLVRRYDDSGNAQTTGAGCSGTIATTSCTESAVPPGTWRYRVTALNAKWRGSESPASAPVRVLVQQTLTTSAWDLRDASAGGSAVNVSDPIAFPADGRTVATSTPPTSFNTSRYLEIDANGPLPTNASPISAAFNMRFAAGAGSSTACFYFDLRRASTNAVLATHGSAANPVGCVTGTAQTSFSTALPAVSSTAIANDLRVRVYVRRSGGAAPVVDQAAVSVVTSQGAFALYDEVFTDRLSGGATTRTWPLVASGDTTYVSASNWLSAFSPSRYLRLTFPVYVASSATVSGASFLHRFRRSGGGGSACWYLEVLQGTTVVGTHGSAASPISCTSGGSYRTDTVSLPEISSPARANGVVLRVYVRSSTGRSTEHDQANLTINYAN
ncbi:MAG TPA: fibronectin type III domain-containing protein [Solirubrobacterales bacterium]